MFHFCNMFVRSSLWTSGGPGPYGRSRRLFAYFLAGEKVCGIASGGSKPPTQKQMNFRKTRVIARSQTACHPERSGGTPRSRRNRILGCRASRCLWQQENGFFDSLCSFRMTMGAQSPRHTILGLTDKCRLLRISQQRRRQCRINWYNFQLTLL